MWLLLTGMCWMPSFDSCTKCEAGILLSPETASCGCTVKNCSLCTQGGLCDSCASSYFLNQEKNACAKCQKCSSKNPETCTECINGLFLNKTTGNVRNALLSVPYAKTQKLVWLQTMVIIWKGLILRVAMINLGVVIFVINKNALFSAIWKEVLL